MRIPSVPPALANPAQIPTALARSSSGNTLVIVDRVPGIRRAAPMPITARSAISWLGVVAADARPEAAPKSVTPAINVPRRPKRSPIAPAGNSNAARASAYASTIHCWDDWLAPRSAASCGSEVASIDTPATIITNARHIAARMRLRCSKSGLAALTSTFVSVPTMSSAFRATLPIDPDEPSGTVA